MPDASERRSSAVTGIFYHPSFSRRSYLTQGSRLQDFPHALQNLLKNPAVKMYESPPVSEDLILKVHTPDLIQGVLEDPLCSTAWHSAGGVVLAAEKIASDEIRNAFAFIGAGGHHSGRDFFGGYCCFNDVVMAIHVLRERYDVHRIAILDTDAHHGDGTRALVRNDPEILHVCVCSSNYESEDGTKVDIAVPGRSWFPSAITAEDVNERYVQAATQAFAPRAQRFKPEFLFWYFGFDTHRGDYGDIGLTRPAYLRIGAMMKQLAQDHCRGRLEVVLGGGSRSDIARDLIPPIIRLLAEDVQPEESAAEHEGMS